MRELDQVARAGKSRLQELGVAIRVFGRRDGALLKPHPRLSLDPIAERDDAIVERERPLESIDVRDVGLHGATQALGKGGLVGGDDLLLERECLSFAVDRAQVHGVHCTCTPASQYESNVLFS